MSRSAAKPAPGAFSADGHRYLVTDPDWIERADGDLWNDRQYLQMDHRGRVKTAMFLQPNWSEYSEGLRAFFVRDDATGRFWSAPHEPVQAAPDRFEFSVGQADLRWTVEQDGLRAEIEVVVPRDDLAELWSATVTNVSRRARQVSLYTYLPAGLRSVLAQKNAYLPALNAAVFEAFPYYVRFADYYRLREFRNSVCAVADTRPDAFELSIEDFAGKRGLHDPAGLRQPRLRSSPDPWEMANERAAAIFQYARRLAPGKGFTVRLAFGPAQDPTATARALKRRYLKPGGFERARAAGEALLRKHTPTVRVETPDTDFNHFLNVWLPRRSLMLARTLRHTYAPQGRNVIQDAMGGVYTAPEMSRHWFSRIWAHQHVNGWLPHGMAFAEGADQPGINKIPHKDINVWGPTSVAFYLAETGDMSLLDEVVPFADKPEQTASLYEHIAMGLEWLLGDRTPRGLCRIGQGDWNDPLNMAGKDERGESVWLTQALAHALDVWAEIATRRGDTARAAAFPATAAALRETINRLAWDGQWYVRGFTDAGRPFGTRRDREGRMFINSQSWAVIAGAADARQTRALIRAMEKHLMTPVGPMTLAPAFTRMAEDIGKLTQKLPGWNENGSVYSHAATFYAYALYVARDPDKAFTTLRTLLPGFGGNPIERCGQIPTFVPNFYRGAGAGCKAGLSSHNGNTGTVSWYARTVFTMLLGVRPEYDGLRLDPQLPAAWPGARVWRRWRGAEFAIEIARGDGRPGAAPEVWLDGARLDGNLVPPQPAGTKHVVWVLVG